MKAMIAVAATGFAALLAAQAALAHGGMHGGSFGRSMRGLPMHDFGERHGEHQATRDFHDGHFPHGDRHDHHEHGQEPHAEHTNDGRWHSASDRDRGRSDRMGQWHRVPGFGEHPHP